jgi:predicted nucleic acid-binding protein
VAKTDTNLCVVVLDAGPLIHLDELSVLNLLDDFSELLVPDEVWNEVERHRPRLFDSSNLVMTRIHPQKRYSPALVALSQLFPLHAGETQALQIAAEQEVDLLLSDDTAARLAAQQLDIPVHGSLGILLRAIRRRQLSTTQVMEILHELPQRSTLHVKPSLLQSIIDEVASLE